MTKKKIFIFTGEHSGEKLGASLLQVLYKENPHIHVDAMGGDILKQAGADIILSNQGLDIIGFFEVFKHLPRLFKLWKSIKEAIIKTKPDLIILIDNPGLNLKIAKFAKEQGIKVLFYVSPQIWAWKAGRIKRIKRDVDHMALLFPFEQKIYQEAGVEATIVGHPMLERFQQMPSQASAKEALQFPADKKILAILPGSRPSEIKRLLPTLLSAAQMIHQTAPDIQIIIAQADSIKHIDIPAEQRDYITAIKQQTDTIVRASDAVICTSGTATLEVALQERPLVIIYKTSAPTYQLAKRLVKTKHIGLCNIVAEQEVAKELIQHEASAENIAAEALKLLNDTEYRTKIAHNLANIREKCGGDHQPQLLVKVIQQLLDLHDN